MATLAAAATVYVSPAGNDGRNPLEAAYRAAAPGHTIQLASGSYGDTTLRRGSAARIVAAPGARVRLGDLDVSGSHIELERLQTQTINVGPDAHDVTFKDMTLRNFEIVSSGSRAPTNISFIGGSIGPSRDDNNRIASNGESTTASPTNVLLDGVTIHDFTLSPGSSAHVECLQVWAADGLTIRNSTFRNCEVFDVFLQKLPGGAAPTPHDILIENNFLDCCGSGFFSIRLADHEGTSWRNVTIRNNSSNKAINPDQKVPYANVQIVGNIAPQLDTGGAALPAGIRADYNVWYSGRKVGAHDQVAPAGYVNAAGKDFHLAAGAAAIDHGDPGSFPGTDIDFQARPSGSAPDAGADERSTAPPVTGPGGTPPPPGGTPTPPGPAPLPPGARILRFKAAADAALRRASPRRRGGKAKLLPVSRGRDALLRFDVKGVGSGQVARARLRLWVARGSAGKLTLRRTSSGWRESRASWRRSPKGRARLATLKRVKADRYVTVGLTKAVTRDGALSLRLSSRARRGLRIASRARGKHAPRLEVAVTGS